MKCFSETLQYLLYFMYKKSHVVVSFFISCHIIFLLDDELQTNISMVLICCSLRSPDNKTCFSFALGCIQTCLKLVIFQPICPTSTQPHQNGPAFRQVCMHPRAKLKHVLLSEDLKEQHINTMEILVCNSSSKVQFKCRLF